MSASPLQRQLSLRWFHEWAAFVWSSIPGAVLAVLAAWGVIPEALAMALFAVSFVGLNLMHMGATWLRVYIRPRWRSHTVERLVVPIALASFAVIFEALGGGALLLAIQYFLSFHQALMQNYGLVRMAERRSGRMPDFRLDIMACLTLPAAALLYRATAVCGRYAGAPLPAFPMAIIAAIAAVGALALLAFVGREWGAYRSGEHVDPLGLGLIAGTNLLWSTLLIVVPHPATPLYALASGHYAQYLFFVWRTEQRESMLQRDTQPAGREAHFFHSSPLLYLASLLIVAAAVTIVLTVLCSGLRQTALAAGLRPDGALEIPAWAAAMIGVNLEHYWLDHRIWRTRKLKPALAVA